LPFLPLFDDVSGVASSRILKRSGFAINDDVSFGGMGGKSGKKRQGGWQKRQRLREVWPHSRCQACACMLVRAAYLRLGMELSRCWRRVVTPCIWNQFTMQEARCQAGDGGGSGPAGQLRRDGR
jgi:hypothetical protein